ncbi:hypothetical protein RJT34_16270 [Clitoria ternatea]|uniref:Uncharacterized protein n=1 Tax=Clitoria ternatea TaxID=43366 RepID=A0AAN9PC47_CLITE
MGGRYLPLRGTERENEVDRVILLLGGFLIVPVSFVFLYACECSITLAYCSRRVSVPSVIVIPRQLGILALE